MLSYFLNLFVNVQSACYSYSCTDLGPGVCASLTGSQSIYLNTQGCNGGTCDRSEVESNFTLGLATTINCNTVNTPEVPYNITLNTKVPCDTRINTTDKNMNLSTYFTTFCTGVCYSETGNTSDCICGYDGNQYCRPNKSSGVFESFWSVCEQNNNMTDLKTNLLWEYVLQYFVDIATAPYCTDDVYTAIQAPSLDYIIDTRAVRILPIIALHWML